MAKRHVQVTSEADSDGSPPPEAPRASNGQFQAGGRVLKTQQDPIERQWENDAPTYHNDIADVLAEADAAEAAVEGQPPAPPPPDAADPDQAPPDETAPPAAAAKPAETREVEPTYLSAAQRADVMRKLEQSKREREKDVEIQRIQKEHEALQAQLSSPRLAERIKALGKTPEELLEDLLLGRGDADDKAVATAAGVNPEVAELRATVAAMQKKEADREAAQQKQAADAETLRAVNVLAAKVNKDSGHVMIHALRQHGRLLSEIEGEYDGTIDVNAVAAVIADRIETQLRTAYPDVAAVLAAGGSPAAVAAAAKVDGAPVQVKAKPSLGARGRVPTNDEPVNDLSLDPGERHQGTKDRFFPNHRR